MPVRRVRAAKDPQVVVVVMVEGGVRRLGRRADRAQIFRAIFLERSPWA